MKEEADRSYCTCCMALHRTWIELNERALASNIVALKRLSSTARFCAVVKANGYGHGMKEISQIAARNGVDAFGVDSIDEALFLRGMLPSALILTLGYTPRDRFPEALAGNIDLTVYDAESIKALESEASRRAGSANIHLKLETGTARQGVQSELLSDILKMIASCPHVKIVGLSTHFATIEDTMDTRFATQQMRKFHEMEAQVRSAGFSPTWIHCACSAAIILYPDIHGTLVRGGIAMYGIWPSVDVELAARKNVIKCDLSPVLSWKSRIAQVKSFPTGTPVGYCLTEILKRPSRIAVVPVGYYDGYDRGLSSTGEALVNGHRCKVIGRVCMNMMMVDVSEVPNVCVEQEVVLLGRSGRHAITVEELAQKTGTIPYEILARINPLLPRILV